MKAKSVGRTNQRSELRKTTNKRLLCTYGKVLYQSPAVEVWETYRQCVTAGFYGTKKDLDKYSETIVQQMAASGDPRKIEFFHLLVLAPMWKALCKSDAKFFREMSAAIERSTSNQQELAQHNRLFKHMDDQKNKDFKYSHQKIADIINSVGGEVNVNRLLKDAGLTLVEGRLVEGMGLGKKRQIVKKFQRLSSKRKVDRGVEISEAENFREMQIKADIPSQTKISNSCPNICSRILANGQAHECRAVRKDRRKTMR